MVWNQYKVVELLKDIKKNYGEEDLYYAVEEVFISYSNDNGQLEQRGIDKIERVLKNYDCYEEYEHMFEEDYADGGETDTLRIEIEEDRDGYEVNYQFDDYEITGVLEKYYTGRGNDYKFIPSYFADKSSEDYYNDNWEDVEDEILSVFHSKFKKGGQVKKRRKYGEGGSVEQGNLEMMKNQAIQVKHHADELIEALKQNPRIDAWVVSLMDRATQNLSNITHYLDGELKHFAKGGMMMKKGGKIHYSYTNAHGYMVYRDGKALESFKTEEQAKRFIKRIERK
jgi:hypothetical protein